jgi:hypothetical protein
MPLLPRYDLLDSYQQMTIDPIPTGSIPLHYNEMENLVNSLFMSCGTNMTFDKYLHMDDHDKRIFLRDLRINKILS